MPHGMCYSHYGNGVCKGAISIAQWGLLSDCYKVNPIGQGGNILVIVMGFVDMFQHWQFESCDSATVNSLLCKLVSWV